MTILIGIDPGVNTGFAVWDKRKQKLIEVKSLGFHQAQEAVNNYHQKYGKGLFVRVEDARLRKWFGNKGREVLQGVGSVKRDSQLWSEFLQMKQIEHQMIHPITGATKLNAERFKALTGWKERTNEHARDAAMLVVGR